MLQGLEKNPKSINVGPTFIPDYRVLQFFPGSPGIGACMQFISNCYFSATYYLLMAYCLVASYFCSIKSKCVLNLYIPLISFNSTTVPLNGGSGGNLGFNAYYFNVSGTFFLTVEQTEMASNLCRHLLKVKKIQGYTYQVRTVG